jgi:hypothetical protein
VLPGCRDDCAGNFGHRQASRWAAVSGNGRFPSIETDDLIKIIADAGRPEPSPASPRAIWLASTATRSCPSPREERPRARASPRRPMPAKLEGKGGAAAPGGGE